MDATPLVLALFLQQHSYFFVHFVNVFLFLFMLFLCNIANVAQRIFEIVQISRSREHGDILESVDSIYRDERGFPLTQYITNWGISRARNTITHFKQHHRVLRLISNLMSV